MKKKNIFSLLVALLLLVGCDYNDKNFEGLDELTGVTNVANYTCDFTGVYPSNGYFSDKPSLEKDVNTFLLSKYFTCDAGSMAKVSVMYGDVTDGFDSTNEAYTLTVADYDAMGTDAGQPGKSDNFDSKMDVDAYLMAFCTTKYATLLEGKTVAVTYNYYSGSVAAQTKCYRKTATGWEVIELNAFTPSMAYTLLKEDYTAMGTATGQPGKYANFDANMNIDHYLTAFLKIRYPYAVTGATCQMTYAYFANKVTTNPSRIYEYDGTMWSYINPFAKTVVVMKKVAEMKFDGKAWKLGLLLGGTQSLVMGPDQYAALVEWVRTNKTAYLSTQNPSQEEFYFGSSSKYFNINNVYATWKNYYNVGGEYDGKTNAEIQVIMDSRMAEGIANALLPTWVKTPDPGLSYAVTYKIYGGRGDGYYHMPFMYNAETQKYERVGDPVKE